VTVRDIDLATEEFVLGGKRLTEERADSLAAKAERRAVGRPSLSAVGRRSPALNLRVSEDAKARLDALARAQGRRQSDVVRDALNEYLQRHSA
jgi:hypothetical protein